MCKARHRGGPVCPGSRVPRPRQRGQALVYGLFVLIGGLAMLFFLFNTGQLAREKTKLVNTADAVAYSAGVVNARALNHAAYTNRALIANEVSIAQMVSLASWAQYLQTHAESTGQLGCQTYYAEPVAKGMTDYAPMCMALYYLNAYGVVEPFADAVQEVAEAATGAAEMAKQALQAAQHTLVAVLPRVRQRVMNEVAEANYAGDGVVEVDAVPLKDGLVDFEGGPFMQRRSGQDRGRFQQATLKAAGLDPFVPSRSWRSEATVPTCIDLNGAHFDYVQRAGGTTLVGYDEWRALDTVSIWRYRLRGRFVPRCRVSEDPLGYGAQSAGEGSDDGDAPGAGVNPRATDMASSEDWRYSGLPGFLELSATALSHGGSGTGTVEPRLDLAVRVTRANAQTLTSEARAQLRPERPADGSLRLNRYAGQPAQGVYAGVSASQAFFERPAARADGHTELASLFNPYWQVRLIDAAPYAAMARAIQGVGAP